MKIKNKKQKQKQEAKKKKKQEEKKKRRSSRRLRVTSHNMTKPSRKEKLITAIRTLQNQLAIATAMEEAAKVLLSDDSSSDSDSDIEFLEEVVETISKTRYLVPRKKIAKSTAGIDLVLNVSERDSASLSI
jgi:adenine deaminase